MSVQEIRQSPMMSHLLDAMQQGKDIGHYGRLSFAMVAQYFMKPDELVKWLEKGGASAEDAKALVAGVEERGYNPPSRGQILAWQKQQEFQICPNPDDPNACNVYQELSFPDSVYQNIKEYREEQFNADLAGTTNPPGNG